MSSSAEQLLAARFGGPARPSSGPRVGVLRGVTASPQRVVADVRPPVGHYDPRAAAAARDAAVEEGYAEGYAAGMAAAQQQIADANADHARRCAMALQALTDAVADLQRREATSLLDVADQTAALALQIAEVVLDREIASAADPGRDAIARAIALAPEEGDVTIRLNPADVAALDGVDDLVPGRGVTVIGDPSVASGGCLIGVGATRIDAQIPTALARVAEVLR